MLAQGQIDRYPAALVELFAQVEQDIMADIARRIAKTDLLTSTAKWQAEKVKQMRQAEQYVMQQIAALSHKSWAELRRVFDEAATETLEFDDHIYEAAGLTPSALSGSPALKAVIEEGLKKTGGLYKNLTGTIANTVAKQFEDALDHAYLQVISGAFSPQSAIRSAVKALAAAGMQTIRYPSGHRDHIDVAIRRATITGLSQTSAQLQLARAKEMGCDLVQVSSHMGARPSHAEWQGKIYSRSGKHPKYPGFVSSTGYGTGEGLCGWNCKHSFYPFFEGLSVDTYKRYDEKENDRVYAQSQRQREYERRIRQSKRECAAYDAAGQPEDFSRSAAKLKRQEQELKDFLTTTDLTRKRDREQVLGFGHSQSSKAVWSAKKHLLKGSEKNDTIKQAPIKDVDGIRSLGTLRIYALEKEFGKLRTPEVVVTKEREDHIKIRHPEDYDLFLRNGQSAIEDPDIILKDTKNEHTVFLIRKIKPDNLNVVIRIVVPEDNPEYKNSVITFYRIRDRNIAKLIRKSPVLYNKE